uniref:Uncharacterized protein n=1 Tax=Arundo donax TaxID=35708 RepID=A0A0A9FVD3_ARUDO
MMLLSQYIVLLSRLVAYYLFLIFKVAPIC